MGSDDLKPLRGVLPKKALIGISVLAVIGLAIYGIRTTVKLKYEIKLTDAQIKDLQQQALLRQLDIDDRVAGNIPQARVAQTQPLSRSPFQSQW